MDTVTIVITLVLAITAYLTMILVAKPLQDRVKEPFNMIVFLIILIVVLIFAEGCLVPIVLNMLGLS